MEAASNRKDGVVWLPLNSDQEGQLLVTGTLVVQPMRLCSVESKSLGSSCSTLHGTHKQLARTLLVGSVCELSPTDLNTTPGGIQVTGDPHMCRESRHCRTSESSRGVSGANLMSWLLLMGNTWSYLKLLHLLGFEHLQEQDKGNSNLIEEAAVLGSFGALTYKYTRAYLSGRPWDPSILLFILGTSISIIGTILHTLIEFTAIYCGLDRVQLASSSTPKLFGKG